MLPKNIPVLCSFGKIRKVKKHTYSFKSLWKHQYIHQIHISREISATIVNLSRMLPNCTLSIQMIKQKFTNFGADYCG